MREGGSERGRKREAEGEGRKGGRQCEYNIYIYLRFELKEIALYKYKVIIT